MTNFIIHIGIPRVGTTVLQKHLFPKCASKIIFSKRPFKPSAKITNKSKSVAIWSPKDTNEYIDSVDLSKIVDKHEFAEKVIFPVASCMSHNSQISNVPKMWEPTMKRMITLLSDLSLKIGKEILISSERLCDTAASLICQSRHSNFSWRFPVFPLVEYINKSNKGFPLIVVGFREPITFLRSKYLRTVIQRESMKERFLTPREFIHKQSRLELIHPGTSVLTPAMHSFFLTELQKVAYVKAFGFRDLIESEDVFTLLGIENERKYAFKNFPKENKMPFTESQEIEIENEIVAALKIDNFYKIITDTKIFE